MLSGLAWAWRPLSRGSVRPVVPPGLALLQGWAPLSGLARPPGFAPQFLLPVLLPIFCFPFSCAFALRLLGPGSPVGRVPRPSTGVVFIRVGVFFRRGEASSRGGEISRMSESSPPSLRMTRFRFCGCCPRARTEGPSPSGCTSPAGSVLSFRLSSICGLLPPGCLPSGSSLSSGAPPVAGWHLPVPPVSSGAPPVGSFLPDGVCALWLGSGLLQARIVSPISPSPYPWDIRAWHTCGKGRGQWDNLLILRSSWPPGLRFPVLQLPTQSGLFIMSVMSCHAVSCRLCRVGPLRHDTIGQPRLQVG